jgi:hypothetical protein
MPPTSAVQCLNLRPCSYQSETDLAGPGIERIDSLLETYLLALAGLDQCPDSAPGLVKDRLAANVERAERVFSDAAADGLEQADPSMQAAADRLDLANEEARRCLREARPIVNLVDDLERATAVATEMIGALGQG